MSGDLTILLALALPLGGALLMITGDRTASQIEAISVTTAALLFLLVLFLLPPVAAGERPDLLLFPLLPGLRLGFLVEPFGMAFALLASFLWIVTAIYSIGYMQDYEDHEVGSFHACFAVSLAATVGVAFAGNLITLFAFYEVLTIATFPLVTFDRTDEALRAGRIYLGVLLASSIGLLLLAILWTWTLTGTLDFAEGGILANRVPPGVGEILLVLYVLGTAKTALMPLHRWLPAAMVAPTPVSALLHAVAVVKTGVFTVLKLAMYVFGPVYLLDLRTTDWLEYLAAFTLLAAGAVAVTQDNLKARLAYSTISQLAYIVLGGLLANEASLVGAGLHMVTHGFAKITLFFSAGAILMTSGRTKVSEMDGLGRSQPLVMACFALASLGIVGLPPFGGFWSKLQLVLGALDGRSPLLAVAMLGGSLLSLAYLLPVPIRAFFGRADGANDDRPLPRSCQAAILIATAGGVLLFFFSDPLYDLLDSALGPEVTGE
jgi:multicomponent Na+:H+ antiporter subunit D